MNTKERRKYRKQFWTAAELADLRRLYADSRTADLARRFGRTVLKIYTAAVRYGLKKSAAYLASPSACRLRRGDNVGAATRFKKGHVPANKGLRRPGWAPGRMAETQFKKGHRSSNYLPIGTVRQDSDGYLRVKIANGKGGFGNPKVWAFIHRRVWKAAHGRIPKGHRIWWKDGNHRNCALENLELVTDQEHMARTTIHNLPPEIKQVIQLNAALKRKIARLEQHGEKQNLRPAGPPLRDPRSLEGQRIAAGP
jgi:hypothetical protein